MGGIHLQDGSSEQEHDPLVIDVCDVVVVGHEPCDEMVVSVHHEHPCEDEKHPRREHDAAQPLHGGVVALISLPHLHGNEEQGPKQIDPRKHITVP